MAADLPPLPSLDSSDLCSWALESEKQEERESSLRRNANISTTDRERRRRFSSGNRACKYDGEERTASKDGFPRRCLGFSSRCYAPRSFADENRDEECHTSDLRKPWKSNNGSYRGAKRTDRDGGSRSFHASKRQYGYGGGSRYRERYDYDNVENVKKDGFQRGLEAFDLRHKLRSKHEDSQSVSVSLDTDSNVDQKDPYNVLSSLLIDDSVGHVSDLHHSSMDIDEHVSDTRLGDKASKPVFVDVTNKFQVQAPEVVKEHKEEDDAHRLKQRQRQIEYGKNTLGYERYCDLVPRHKRKRTDPQTPNPKQVCSKRSWDGQIRKWRRLLHTYDPPLEDGEEVAEDFTKLKSDDVNEALPDDMVAEENQKQVSTVKDASLDIYEDWMES